MGNFQFRLSLLCMISLIVVACQEPPPIRVAILTPLTRFSSEFGSEGRNGALLAIEEINASGGIGGRMLRSEIHDVGGGADSCEILLNGLLKDGIHYIIGPYTSNMAEATMRAMQGQNALLITPTMSASMLEGKNDAILRMQASNLTQTAELAKLLRKRRVHRILAIYDVSNREYSYTLVEGLRNTMAEAEFLIDSIVPGTREPQVLASGLGREHYDGIYIASMALPTAAFAQTLRRNGNKSPLYGCSWNMTDEILAQGGSAVDGMVFTGPTPPAGVSLRGREFETRFIRRFGKVPSFAGAESYEAIYALAYGLRNAGTENPRAVRDTLLHTVSIRGVYDDFTWNSFGDVHRPVILVEIYQGRYRGLSL